MELWEQIVTGWQRVWTEEDCVLSITVIGGFVLVMIIPKEEYYGEE